MLSILGGQMLEERGEGVELEGGHAAGVEEFDASQVRVKALEFAGAVVVETSSFLVPVGTLADNLFD